MRISLARFKTFALCIINLALVASILWLWRNGQEQIDAPARLVAKHLPLPDLSAIDPLPAIAIDTASLTDNAVFYSSRAFYRPAAPIQVAPPPDFLVTGIMGLGDGKRIAFMKKPGEAANRAVHVFDDLEGWRVDAIANATVTISKEGQTIELSPQISTSGIGLLRSPAPPHQSVSGLRVLGGGSSSRPAAAPMVTAARTYRPPPQ